MDTVNDVATAGNKAGNGDANREPVSGIQGDVSKGEPYDAGNMGDDEQKKAESRLSDDQSQDKTAPADTSATPEGDDTTAPTGPGPKPLEVIAREHGGDAGREKERKGQGSGDASEKDDVAPEESTGEKPAGTEYVKTTGFAAEGGDFDATKPGAGREADRLLEQKGMPRDDHAATEQSTDAPTDNNNSKSNPSLSQRIKAKLHRH